MFLELPRSPGFTSQCGSRLPRRLSFTGGTVLLLGVLLTIGVAAGYAQSPGGVMTSPANNSSLTGSTVNFQWSAGTSATAYWIDVGNVAGGNNYYSSGNLGDVLTATASGLPTDGSTIFVTLYSLIDGTWTPNSYTYTAFNPAAGAGAITSPVNGSTLSGSSVTFTWMAGSSATAYWVDVGSTAGANNYYTSGNLGNVFTVTASGLPVDGSTIYVTFYSFVGGVWTPTAYTYTAFNESGIGQIVSPAGNSTLTGSSVTFNWAAGMGATAYWLDVGSTAGANNYYTSGNLGNVLTATVNGLPTNGSTVYATLYSMVGGNWLSNGYSYTALNPAAAAGAMTTPVPGSTLMASSVTFNWTAGSGASAYWVDIGSTAGANNYYSSGSLGNVLSTTVYGLPTNGSMVYVTLYSSVAGSWVAMPYTYTAFNLASAAGTLTSPMPGSTLTGSSVTFNWTAGASASAYWVDVGNGPGANNYYTSGNLGNVQTLTVSGLPTDASTIYVTLYSQVSGSWVGNGYSFTAFNLVGAGGVMNTPAPGSILAGSSVTFSWTAGSGASAYWVDIGSTAGANNYYTSGNLGNVLSTTVNGLPTNGSAAYVTLYSYVAGNWLGTTYTYSTATPQVVAAAVITTPTPGSILGGSSVTFNWNAANGASAYWLDVGSAAGANNYYSSGSLGNVLTTTVNGLPTNSSMIYATLYSLFSSGWTPNSYTYTSFGGSAGSLVTPVPGSTLTANTVTFNWTAGTGATAYWLDIGSTAGGNNYYSSGNTLGTALTTTVSGLPINGSMVYATLYSLIAGSWTPNSYSFTAFNASVGLAAMLTPIPGSTLSGNTATFTWSGDVNATGYWVDIGSTAGANDVYRSGNLGNVLTTTVLSLPATGTTIYVTLYSLVDGTWLTNTYTYVSQAILTYSARTDNCVNGTQTGCVSNTTTGQAGANLIFQEGLSDPIPTGFLPTTISSGACPSGWVPTSYPAYCPAPMNSTATDPDFGAFLVMATDEDTNLYDAPITPYKTSWNMASDGDWDAFSWDETLLLIKNAGNGEEILNINPAAIHAQTCATAPGCVNKSGIHDAASGGGTSTTLAHNGNWSWSRVATEPHTLYELADIPTQINQVTVTSSIGNPLNGTLTRIVYADFQMGTGPYGGVMNTAAPGNSTTYNASWTGSFQVADDGSVSYAMTGGYDWQASWAVTVPDTFILPMIGNTGKYGFQATTGGTTAAAEPAWCQTSGCTVADGSVVWTNIGVLNGQGPGFDVVIYRPPSTSAPGYTRINTRLGKIYRGSGNSSPAGYMTTNDQVVCTRAGTYPEDTPCLLPDRFTLHEAEEPQNGRYLEIVPTGGGGSNAAGNWNSGTLSCQTSNGIWSGAWSSTTTYVHLDVVTYNGYYWNANNVTGNLNHPPPTSGWPTGNTYWTGSEAYCNDYIFDTTSTLVAPDTDWLHGSGHGDSGYLNKFWGSTYRSMLWSLPVIDGVLNPDTAILKAPLPCDDHGTYRNSGINDLTPMFTSTTDVPSWPSRYDVSNGACYEEICAFNSQGTGLTYRFGHTYNTGSSQYFQIQNNIGVVSPFGDLVAFDTDMMGVRGANNAANTACNNLRGQYQPAASGKVTYQDAVYPITNNNHHNIFRATACGANTNGATCTEGTTLPNWDTACTTTCTDGGVTWTNEGANNCRGDIVILDALSSHAAPE